MLLLRFARLPRLAGTGVRIVSGRQMASASAALAEAERTSLYDFHLKNRGKMVPFAGYLLPVQYEDLSHKESHLHTRRHASVFDVSHMLQTYVKGKDAIECFESICTADIGGLPDGSGTLTVFTDDKGGILDDLIVNRVRSDLLYVVSNAACKKQDAALILEAVERYKRAGKKVDVQFMSPDERALLALQGPDAAKALQDFCDRDLSDLYFMTTTEANVAGINDCRVTRCGYTGEDGFEISVPAEKGEYIAETLLASNSGNVKLAGLGARDSLRLEAGLCLYGNDIDVTTTPIEAALAWLVAKRRRTEANFPGANVILRQLKDGVSRRRVGFQMEGSRVPPARHGVPVIVEGETVGEVTSGGPSVSLPGCNVGMGYIAEKYKKVGTKVELKIRDKLYPGVVAKMPFVPSNYYQKPKQF